MGWPEVCRPNQPIFVKYLMLGISNFFNCIADVANSAVLLVMLFFYNKLYVFYLNWGMVIGSICLVIVYNFNLICQL